MAEAFPSLDDSKSYALRRAEDREQIMSTGAYLAHRYLLKLQQATDGYVWPHGRLADLIQPHHPEGPAYTQPESTSQYMVRREDGSSRMTTHITPANAVVCDYDTVQTDLLDYVVRKHAPRNVRPVRTQDPNVPAIRLLKATVEDLDGTVTEYPVNAWDMQRQSGRQDGKPQPTGDRLPHTHIAKVRRIELTMEIRHRDSQDSDVFTFETDVYSDQDRTNYLLLITQDSSVSDTELEDIAYLHNPRLPHDTPPKVRDTVYESLSDTYQTYLVDQLRNGPEHAALSLLGRVAAALDALGLNDSQETTPATINATSSSGKVRITLNPPRGTPFHMPDPPVNFIQVDLQHLPDDATVLFLPTEEPPGAIRPGHVLIYSPYDGKLETFQPRDTHFTHRVHPFTIRPRQSQNLRTVQETPDTGWLVVGVAPTYLLLHAVGRVPLWKTELSSTASS